MQTYDEMKQTVSKLQAELDREKAYTQKVNDRYNRMRERFADLQEQNNDSISKYEHEKIIARIRREYEQRLSEASPRIYNERGAGRKPIVSKEVMAKVMALRSEGLSHAKIAARLVEQGIQIGRTTVGEIVCGSYIPLDAE